MSEFAAPMDNIAPFVIKLLSQYKSINIYQHRVLLLYLIFSLMLVLLLRYIYSFSFGGKETVFEDRDGQSCIRYQGSS
ncbi:hypothetical protein NADFUDRAFT_81164 [Nadsonia fulvescens var. elongata DSM 6958]|uniref:Uncharacterized protein n=1 Tax=Nadsonia fulvescens var. elongata DSM 6958 TaxID=857566 RepID=A0A1E3PRP7_9ASCO|nr:hypothetical protein NADFUDRAFT_81164 [Nadsonia fulvescens var. elongata DSM 6958]